MSEPATRTQQTGRVWKAMADPARRRILDLLREAPRTTGFLASDLEARVGIGRFMVMKHLKQLADAGLLLVVRRGRERFNHLNAVPIREIYHRWIQPFAVAAADSMLRLKNLTETGESHPTGEPPMTEAAQFEVKEIVVEVVIRASREKVWHAITADTSSWWPRDFYVGSDAKSFHIEPRIGGHMFEDWGDGEGAIWATVTLVKKHEKLRLSSEVWPEYGGPARTIQRYDLSDADGGGTTLRFTDTMYGRVTESSMASLNEGWNYLMGRALKDYVEEGKRPPDQSPLAW